MQSSQCCWRQVKDALHAHSLGCAAIDAQAGEGSISGQNSKNAAVLDALVLA
jgi:hypothetical protein